MDGSLGAWAARQGCSVTCGSGIKRRYRKCDSPTPDYGGKTCPGVKFDEQACSGKSACPGNCFSN
ncbi:hypothetical protein DPMN_125231 [Dreissena polymorpha]|uniref:GCM domain-containing protein n=1 Tax=Dreissena polymorpha TaxID=45954 RepID=A0A9D4JWW9_DREPO|nr:hypothetical protein DPMN_125231 [Dreissena polymorpha]